MPLYRRSPTPDTVDKLLYNKILWAAGVNVANPQPAKRLKLRVTDAIYSALAQYVGNLVRCVRGLCCALPCPALAKRGASENRPSTPNRMPALQLSHADVGAPGRGALFCSAWVALFVAVCGVHGHSDRSRRMLNLINLIIGIIASFGVPTGAPVLPAPPACAEQLDV